MGNYSPGGDSAYGCADMAGNVGEWTDSWFDEDRTKGRVRRGGSYFNPQAGARSAFRGRLEPGRSHIDVGFRIAAPPSES